MAECPCGAEHPPCSTYGTCYDPEWCQQRGDCESAERASHRPSPIEAASGHSHVPPLSVPSEPAAGARTDPAGGHT